MATKLPITLLKPSGIAGQVLTSNGPDDPPEWAAGGGGTSDRPPSLRADFGGVGNGVANDTAAITAAEASSAKVIYVPEGTFWSPTIVGTTLTKTYVGEGKLKVATAGAVVPRGSMLSVVSQDPGVVTNNGEPQVGFQGDWSGVPIAVEHYILGADTLGTVGETGTAGYFRPNTNAAFFQTYTDSGVDETLPGAPVGRRTASVGVTSNMLQYGHGDAGCFNANCFIGGSQASTDSTLKGKAGILYNGQVGTVVPSSYLNPIEINSHDNGTANVSAAGAVFNMYRDHPGTFDAPYPFWYGLRLQNFGTCASDVGLSIVGAWKHGIDFTYATLDNTAGRRAITMRSGDKIYFCAQRDDPSGVSRYPSNAKGSYIAGATWDDTSVFVAIGNQSRMEWRADATAVLNKPIQFYDGATLVGQIGGTGNAQIYLGAPGHQVELNQMLKLTSQTTSTTAGVLSKYLSVAIEGVTYKIPLYNT